MTAPQRWILSPGESTREERSLLKQGLDVGPPPDAEDRTWKAIMAQLGPVGPAAPPALDAPTPDEIAAPLPVAPAAAPVTAIGLGATKVGALVVAASTLLLTGYATLRGAEAPIVSSAPIASTVRVSEQHPELPDITPALAAAAPAIARSSSVAPVEPSAPIASAVQVVPRPVPVAVSERAVTRARAMEVSTARTPVTVAPGEATPTTAVAAIASAPAASGATMEAAAPSPQAERASRLREESALVGQANAALRGGNAGEALRLLTDAGRRFPDGVLGQERELLMIEALGQSGQRAAASEHAARFMQAHPRSPHAARLQPYLP